MNVAPEKRGLRLPRAGLDRKLAWMLGGALLLIVAGLIAIPLATRRQTALADETTPQGVVERFYQALYRGDYTTAHTYLIADTRSKVTVADLQQTLQYDLDNSQARIGQVKVNDASATVQVTLTHYGSGGLFGSNEWDSTNELLLQREDDRWKIVSGFGFFPALSDADEQR